MRTISLFSGCGGMDIGAQQAGAEVIFACDNMPEAAATYATHFGEVDFVLGDIADVAAFPAADLVIGGYPCQSFSMGGNRRPTSDHRTLLFRHFARCLNLVNPKFFVAENVSGMGSVESGRWLREQLAVFAQVGRFGGYDVTSQVLHAADYGVPQRRKRLILVGGSCPRRCVKVAGR